MLTAETWLGPEVTRSGDKALLVVGVSYRERLAAMQRLRRASVVTFAPVEWLTHDQVDETYFKILPTGRSDITAEEAHELAVIFGKDGELAAELAPANFLPANTFTEKGSSADRRKPVVENDMLGVAIVVVVFALLAYDLGVNHGEWFGIVNGGHSARNSAPRTEVGVAARWRHLVCRIRPSWASCRRGGALSTLTRQQGPQGLDSA